MRQFKQITDGPPTGTRRFFVLLGVGLGLLTVLMHKLTAVPIFLPFYFVPYLIGWVGVLVLSFWVARTYAGYLAWLCTIVLVLLARSLTPMALRPILDWSVPYDTYGAAEAVLRVVPRFGLLTLAWLVLVHVGFVLRRLPFLPKLTKESELTFCRRCRYDLTGLGESSRCPECGTESPRIVVRPADRPRAVRAARFGNRFGVATVVVLVLCGVGVLAAHEVQYRSVMRRFAAVHPVGPAMCWQWGQMRMPPTTTVLLEGVFCEDQRLRSFGLLVADAYEIGGDPSRVPRSGLAIGLVEVYDNPLSIMGRRVVAIPYDPSGAGIVYLSPEQSEAVLAGGLPDSLIAAFGERARLLPAATMSSGFMNITVNGGASPTTLPEIDPAAHFPASGESVIPAEPGDKLKGP